MEQISGATAWINSRRSHRHPCAARLYSSISGRTPASTACERFQYITAWNAKYKASGLVVIGVHTPDFPVEKDESNVRKAVKDRGITYPVAMDNDYRIWRNFNKRVLARTLLHRRDGTRSLSPLRRRQLRRVRKSGFVPCSKRQTTSRCPAPPPTSPQPAQRPLPTPTM